MPTLRLSTLLLLPCSTVLAAGRAVGGEPSVDYSFSGRGSTRAVAALLRRTLRLELGDHLPFRLEMVSRCEGGPRPAASRSELCFELRDAESGSGAPGEVLVRGTSAVDIARGAAHYLRAFCNMSFAWARAGGNQVALPARWPRVGSQPVVRWRLRDISYGFNVCTFSYSHVWYSFDGSTAAGGVEENWENLIDWMALSGINLALAYTGQEEVYRKVYSSFGINSTVFAAWSNGPAHLTWSRGQSMHGVGGPLPQSWMEEQWVLQRRILRRMRDLGITPVLPAFQGNVPPLLAELHPAANITVQKAHWGGGRAAWLDATDPLFQAIGDRFMQQVIADFGVDTDGDGVGDATEHWYEADGYFAAGDPPWRGQRLAGRGAEPAAAAVAPTRVASGTAGPVPRDENAFRHAAKAYAAMNATDPKAIWLYQGWILGDDDHDLAAMRGYVAAVPRGRLVVSDMWAEWRPLSGMLAAAGVPYMYGVLQNFGGTLFLGMSLKALNSGAPEDPAAVPSIFETFSSRPGGVGIGAFPEGIDQNPAYYTYLFDANWMSAPADLAAWWRRYACERYGAESARAASAWAALGASVYGVDERRGVADGFWREKAKGGLLSSPLLFDQSDEPSHDWYNTSVVLSAWKDLVAAAADLPRADSRPQTTLRYDVVNVGREVLDKVANRRFEALARARSAPAARAAGRGFLEVQHDADRLLCTDPTVSLNSWLGAARALGHAQGGARLAGLYDRLARAQLTTWLPACANHSEAADGVCSAHLKDEAPPLEDYANKAWGGLVSAFYARRVECYLAQWDVAPPTATSVNATAYHACIDSLAYRFQHDVNGTEFPICEAPEGDPLGLSAALIAKYEGEVHGVSLQQQEGVQVYI
mmetsp:Transcript_81842/g.253998  ORF Transcript_81842/g.253998 Transcript_81842/m.253998 type:complete len:873 (-) Transcript_81842:104-2722(-)